MKKKLLFVLATFMLAITLIGCSSGSNEDTEGSDNVIIEFMHTSVEQERIDVIDGLVEKFESEHPNIKVEQVVTEESNLNTKIITLAQSGELPEVVEVGQDYAKVMDKDELIDKDSVSKIIEEVGEETFKMLLNVLSGQTTKNETIKYYSSIDIYTLGPVI